jgi:zinc protease
MHSKILLCGAIFALLLTGSAQAQVFNPETTTLKNGMQIVVLPNHRAPVVTQMIWVKAGAMDDPWGRSGIAHFCEHLSFKGTPTHPEGDYSKIISHMGGEENAFTSNDYTAFYATIGKEHLGEVMALESDRLTHLQIKDSQVTTERQVILKEREQRTENDPVSAFFENVNAVLYPNHPYQRPTIGWRNEMEILDRSDAEAFIKAHYSPDNLIVVISGDVTLADVKDMAEKTYGTLVKRPITPRYAGRAAPLQANVRIEKTSPLVREIIWSRHRLVAPARVDTIADNDALLALEKIFGDERTGRLYRRLVVKDKIASSAGVSFEPNGIGPQRFSIIATPMPGIDLKKIDEAIDDEIAKLNAKGVTPEEVDNAKQALEISAVYERDSIMGPAMLVGSSLATGMDLKTIEAWPTRMNALTKEKIDMSAKNVFAPDASWVTAILKPDAKAQAGIIPINQSMGGVIR